MNNEWRNFSRCSHHKAFDSVHHFSPNLFLAISLKRFIGRWLCKLIMQTNANFFNFLILLSWVFFITKTIRIFTIKFFLFPYLSTNRYLAVSFAYEIKKASLSFIFFFRNFICLIFFYWFVLFDSWGNLRSSSSSITRHTFQFEWQHY